MKTKVILKSENLGLGFRVDITQSSDSFNGLVYEGEGIEKLICGVAAGLHEGMEKVISKATRKLNKILSASDNIKDSRERGLCLIRQDLKELEAEVLTSTGKKKKEIQSRISEIKALL